MQRKTMLEVYKTTQKLSNECAKVEPAIEPKKAGFRMRIMRYA
jgi:hypothetical protein